VSLREGGGAINSHHGPCSRWEECSGFGHGMGCAAFSSIDQSGCAMPPLENTLPLAQHDLGVHAAETAVAGFGVCARSHHAHTSAQACTQMCGMPILAQLAPHTEHAHAHVPAPLPFAV